MLAFVTEGFQVLQSLPRERLAFFRQVRKLMKCVFKPRNCVIKMIFFAAVGR